MAVDTAVRLVQAIRRTGHIHVDGRLNEPDWKRARVTSAFTQSYPFPGAPARARTSVRVLYDNAALYVGIRMYDPHPDSIAAPLARRDATGIYSDWVHVMIGSYNDRRTAFSFAVNPRGVKEDAYEYNDIYEDVNWDAVWQVATRIDSLGWVAEFRIPFSQLRFGSASPTGSRTWGFQVQRDIARWNERDTWSPWTPQDPGTVSRFGELTGLKGVPVPRRVEVVPYASMQLTRAPGSTADPFYRANATKISAGADIKAGLTGGLTLTGTINPDFGQVEVDPAVVNLTAFETFFPEKRPFFVEGADVFAFGQVHVNNDYGSEQYFYSRRIGRPPERTVVGSGIRYVAAPDQTPIAGAIKITGQTGPWTIGVLDALTKQADAQYFTTSDQRITTPVEPLTNYFAGRVRRAFQHGNTIVGGMVTAANRDLRDPALASLLHGRALFGGVDFEQALNHKAWIISGFVSGSRVDGSSAAIALTQRSSARYYQRPDASYLTFDSTRTTLAGHMGELAVQKTGSYFGSLAYKESSPGFEINDLGFENRTDYRSIATDFGYQSDHAGAHFQRFSLVGATNHVWNFGGSSIDQSVLAEATGTLNDLANGSLSLEYNLSHFDDRLTRGGPLVRVPGQWLFTFSATGDPRRPLVPGAQLQYAHDASGAWNTSITPSLQVRPSPSVLVTVGPSLTLERSTSQYVTTIADSFATATYAHRYVFANLRQTTVAAEIRVNWALSRTLSLQVYTQPFVSVGRYTHFKELARPDVFRFRTYGTNAGTIARDSSGVYTVDPDGAGPAPSFRFGDPNFDLRSLRGDAVLRWGYRPGSALFLVWQQQRSETAPIGDFEAGRDFGAIFRAPATNVFLVKATFWLGK